MVCRSVLSVATRKREGSRFLPEIYIADDDWQVVGGPFTQKRGTEFQQPGYAPPFAHLRVQ